MAAITASLVKQLRDQTGAGMMDCKNALVECEGDMEKAIEYLQKRAASVAVKRMDRDASDGVLATYIHTGSRLGVLLELNCETDFVARNTDFQTLAKDLAIQVAASGVDFISKESIPAEVLDKQREIFAAQAEHGGKPAQVIERIAEGKLKKWYEDICLEDQPWLRDHEKTVKQVMIEAMATIGENIKIRRFVRWEVGS